MLKFLIIKKKNTFKIIVIYSLVNIPIDAREINHAA